MSSTPLLMRLVTACLAITVSCSTSFAQDAEPGSIPQEASKEAAASEETSKEDKVIRVYLNEDGTLEGRVYAMLGSEETPMVAKVSLASEGKTIASGETDVIGKFSFSDVEPGTYTMVGVSGEYVGDQVVVVSETADEAAEEVESEGVYTSLALQVAPVEVYSDAVYSDIPMDSFAAPYAECGSCGVETTCGACDSCGSLI